MLLYVLDQNPIETISLLYMSLVTRFLDLSRSLLCIIVVLYCVADKVALMRSYLEWKIKEIERLGESFYARNIGSSKRMGRR